MTLAQITDLIERNQVTMIMLCDYGGNKLHEITAASWGAAVKELEEVVPTFSEHKKIEVKGKKGSADTPWSKGYSWQLVYAGTAIAGPASMIPASGQIGAMDVVNMYKGMMDQQLALQEKLLEKTLALNNNDPMKWFPLVQYIGNNLGFQGGIQGPPGAAPAAEAGKTLHAQDVDYSKMTGQQMGEKINELLMKLNKKISGPTMIALLVELDNNPDLPTNAAKITTLLKALNNKPGLIDTALQFIS